MDLPANARGLERLSRKFVPAVVQYAAVALVLFSLVTGSEAFNWNEPSPPMENPPESCLQASPGPCCDW